jgi:hypothetical protein
VNPPVIEIWIDPKTTETETRFTAQDGISPAQYGVILSFLFIQIARRFDGASEEYVIQEMLKGLQAGIDQRADMALPQQPH